MKNQAIDLLVTLDENYLPQLQVMLTSLLINSPGEYNVYLIHRSIPKERLEELGIWLGRHSCELYPLHVPEGLFEKAPVTGRYPQEMYYRLLAGEILPEYVKRVLYLDPDTLIINPIRPLWELDIEGKVFAAAAHTGMTELANDVNRIRLGTEGKYFNSGVMLIDLEQARKRIDPETIFLFVSCRSDELILPDQDLLNILFEKEIYEIDDAVWNYDARKYSNYLLRSGGTETIEWVMKNTSVLHFCGSAKPWKKRYPHS